MLTVHALRNGTSMISLIIPPKDQVSRVNKMLADEYGTASNIKSRVNRCVLTTVMLRDSF
jgi:peptide subunit release factor 1 (eRF1)